MFLHARGNVCVCCIRFFFQQADRAHDHAGGAITALEGAFGEERFLDRMKFVAFGEAFDGDDGFFVGVGNWSKACGDAFAVEENGASATLAFAAAIFCPGELEVFAEDIEEWAFGISRDCVGTAVNREFEGRIHRRFCERAVSGCHYTQFRQRRQQSPELARKKSCKIKTQCEEISSAFCGVAVFGKEIAVRGFGFGSVDG